MLKACLLNIPKGLWKNRYFYPKTNPGVIVEADAGFATLKRKLQKQSIDLSTEDINTPEKSDIVISFNIPSKPLESKSGRIDYLIPHETSAFIKDNWNAKYWSQYNKVFSWNPNFVDNIKVFHSPIPYKWKPYNKNVWKQRRDTVALVANCKHFYHKLSLTEKRLSLVRWFAINHPSKLNVFGGRWNEHIYHGTLRKYLRHLPVTAKKALERRSWTRKIYKGPVKNKHLTLEKHRFAISFDNTHSLPGFVTGRIFHCFSAGTVPIYWGASNVSNLFPRNSFIDARRFKSHSNLYDYLSNYSIEDYQNYLKSVQKFYSSKKAEIFTTDHFADTIIKHLKKDLLKIRR